MLWTNKTWTTKRFLAEMSVYISYLESVRFRESPLKVNQVSAKSKQNHIMREFRSDVYDIQVWDRLYTNWKKYVFMTVDDFSDQLGPHIEAVLREIDSPLHQEVSYKEQKEIQGNYDPILKEYVGSGKKFETTQISVLIDPIESAKNSFINIIDAGKMENVDYIMTVELDQKIDKNGKIELYEEVYHIKWIIDLPYQKLVWLTKSLRNYES